MQPQPTSLTDAIPTLEPDIPASEFLLTHAWMVAAIIAAIVLAAALIIFLWWRVRHRRPALPPETALQTALCGMDALEAELPPLRACSLQLSLLLRTYLAGQTSDPALYETHEEFTQRMDALENVPAACRFETRELLEELASYKYAGETESDPGRARALIERSRSAVVRIDEARRAPQEGGAA